MARLRSTRWWVAAVTFAAVGLAVRPAKADAGPKFSSGVWLPVGVTLGAAFRDQLPTGFVLGGEASIVYLFVNDEPAGMWVGGVADAVWDFGSDAFRHRLGPEIGWGPVGIDLAYLGQSRDEDGYRPGISARGVLSIAILSLYGGYGHVFTDAAGADYGEFGGLLKIPIPIDVERRQPWHEEPAPVEDPPKPAPLAPTPAGPYVPVPGPSPEPSAPPPEPEAPAPAPPSDGDEDRYATPPPPSDDEPVEPPMVPQPPPGP